jgi:hypothetical protein
MREVDQAGDEPSELSVGLNVGFVGLNELECIE